MTSLLLQVARSMRTSKSVISQSVRCCSSVYTPRRACLYVPGNDEKKIRKIPSLDVDCTILDCEDGVALNRKVGLEARLI